MSCYLLTTHNTRTNIREKGYTQSGPAFRAKTAALDKVLEKALKAVGLEPVLIYPTAPIDLSPYDEDDDKPNPEWYAWYRKDDRTGEFRRLDEGMNLIADELREARLNALEEDGDEDGGFDCVLGFSQGACMASLLAAALEPRTCDAPAQHVSWLDNVREANGDRPLKSVIMYGGFPAAAEDLEWLYHPKISAPSLHMIGTLDTIVSEEDSRKLAAKFNDAKIVTHPGGHYVPVSKMWSMAVVQFILSLVSPPAAA